jgi:hypothetical protein
MRNAARRGEFYRMPSPPAAKYWTEKAEESRARANEMGDGLARDTMLRIAAEYDKMAEYAAQGERAEAALRKPR